jgi:hypothetical protein
LRQEVPPPQHSLFGHEGRAGNLPVYQPWWSYFDPIASVDEQHRYFASHGGVFETGGPPPQHRLFGHEGRAGNLPVYQPRWSYFDPMASVDEQHRYLHFCTTRACVGAILAN